MPTPEHEFTCEEVRDRIDAFIDGDLEVDDACRVDVHCGDCPSCAAELALARHVTAELRDVPVLECPIHVTDTAFERIDRLARPVFRPWWHWAWRPALAMGIAAVMLLATALVGQRQAPPTPQITVAEIDRAQQQAKWTLIYIAQLSQKTASTLKRELSDPTVARPMQRLIEEQPTQEKHNAS